MAAVTLKHVLTVPIIKVSYLNSKSVVRFVWIAIIENSSFAYSYDRNIEYSMVGKLEIKIRNKSVIKKNKSFSFIIYYYIHNWNNSI